MSKFLSLENSSGANIEFETNNGHRYVIRKIDARSSKNGSWTIPEGMYFVSGDNRDNSSDSREWGVISGESIWGRADYIWLSWPPSGSPSLKRVGKIE